MPVAMPALAATASASSTTSSRDSTRSPSASMPTLHLTGYSSSGSGPRPGSGMRLAQGRQQRRKFFQAIQVMAGEHQVDMRGRHHHSQGAGPEVLVVALVRVHPDHPVTKPGKPLHGLGQDAGITAVEAVGADHHDSAAAQAPPPPVPDESVQRVADPGAALPVEYRLRGTIKRVIRPAMLQGPGHPGQPGTEAEDLDPGRRALR